MKNIDAKVLIARIATFLNLSITTLTRCLRWPSKSKRFTVFNYICVLLCISWDMLLKVCWNQNCKSSDKIRKLAILQPILKQTFLTNAFETIFRNETFCTALGCTRSSEDQERMLQKVQQKQKKMYRKITTILYFSQGTEHKIQKFVPCQYVCQFPLETFKMVGKKRKLGQSWKNGN